MANRKNTFLLKRSNVAGNIPSSGQILQGELALNTADVILYASGTTENSILPIGWDRVSRTGDTVTGDYIINGSLSATTMSADTFYGDGSNLTGIPDNYTTGITIDVNSLYFDRNDSLSAYTVDLSGLANLPTDEQFQLFGNQSSNGVIKFGGFSANTTDTSKFDIGIVEAWHVDNTTDPDNPVVTFINYSGATGLTLTYIATNPVTYIAIDENETIIQSQTPYTPEQTRDYVELGVIIHSDNATVNAINNDPVVGIDSTLQLYDLMESIGIFNDNGNVYTPNGINLNIDKSGGDVFSAGANFVDDNKNPHIKPTTTQTGLTFRYRLQDSTEYGNTTNIDPNNYDLGGVLTTVPINKFTIQRVTLFSSNQTRIQYGQNLYNSLALARQALELETFIIEPNIDQNGLLRAFIIVEQGTTDLTASVDTLFIPADKFGSTIGAGGGSVTDLQKAYDNSINPEIITNPTLGAVEYRSGSGAESDNLIEFEGSGGTVNAWVNGLGDSSFNNLIVNNNTTLSGLTTVYGDTPTSAAIQPGINNTYDLGAPSFRWREIFSTNVDISNTLSTEFLYVNNTSSFNGDVDITGDTTNVGNLLVVGDISGTTISATTYLNLPTDTNTFVTGGTADTGGTITLNRNDDVAVVINNTETKRFVTTDGFDITSGVAYLGVSGAKFLSFDGAVTSDETGGYNFAVPSDYVSGGTFYIKFTTLATANDVQFEMNITSRDNGGDISTPTDTALSATTTGAGTSWDMVETGVYTPSSSTFSPNKNVIVRLNRDASDAPDTYTGVAYVWAVVFEYTGVK